MATLWTIPAYEVFTYEKDEYFLMSGSNYRIIFKLSLEIAFSIQLHSAEIVN